MKSDRSDPVIDSLTHDRPCSRMVGRRELLGGSVRAAAAGAAGLILLGPAAALAGLPAVERRPAGPGPNGAPLPAQDPAVGSLLANIRHGDSAARQLAVLQASLVGTGAIPALAAVVGEGDPGASKAALEAIQRIAHNAARPGAPEERQSAASHLNKVAATGQPASFRGDAVRLLGVVGGAADVTVLSDLLHVPAVREDARMSLERIPDPAAEAALKRASRTVPSDYRAAIAQSLRHRKARPREAGLRS